MKAIVLPIILTIALLTGIIAIQPSLQKTQKNKSANPAVQANSLSQLPNIKPSTLSLKQALEIAKTSICTQSGTLKQNSVYYNENSETWWIDMIGNKANCSPACVITASKSAEINWRCTGLRQ